MASWKVVCFLVFLALGVNSQILFGEEEEDAPAVSPKVSSAANADAVERGEKVSDEVLQVRYGLIAGFLNLDPVAGTKPIGATATAKTLKPNPYVPVVNGDKSARQQGNCLCVPSGKCVRPSDNQVNPSPNPTPNIPAANTDGAGLIDVRIVNRPSGIVCSTGFQYCCLDRNVYPNPNPTPSPSPVTTSCGRSNIIPTPGYTLDPTQAQFGEFPWMVVILGPTNNYIGGGVLVSNRHVITTAHKVFNFQASGLKVRLGEWDAKANIEPFKYVESVVSRIRINPFFNRVNLQNDIAVLTLDRPVDLAANPHINPVCAAQFQSNYAGQRCWVTGWGKDAFGKEGNFQYILKKVDVPVLDSNECEARLRQTRLTQNFQLSRSSFICAGGEEGKDACTGDGGSPLVCEMNGRAELVGLVAWGIGCASDIPGVYVNVRSYSDWLNAELV